RERRHHAGREKDTLGVKALRLAAAARPRDDGHAATGRLGHRLDLPSAAIVQPPRGDQCLERLVGAPDGAVGTPGETQPDTSTAGALRVIRKAEREPRAAEDVTPRGERCAVAGEVLREPRGLAAERWRLPR